LTPLNYTLRPILKYYALTEKNRDEVIRILKIFKEFKIKKNEHVYSILLNYYLLIEKDNAEFQNILVQMKVDSISPNMSMLNTMISYYLNENEEEKAREILIQILTKKKSVDARIFTQFIKNRSKHFDVKGGERYLEMMKEYNVKPDEFTYLVILTMYLDANEEEKGIGVFNEMIEKEKIKPNKYFMTKIIDFYLRRDKEDMAKKYFDSCEMYGIENSVDLFHPFIR
jgi:pentatricopeptide repeat protein